MKKTFSIVSLGCFRNTYDSEILAGRLKSQNYRFVDSLNPHTAAKRALLVINTCGFIDKAKEESLRVIQDAVTLKRKGMIKKIAVCGCLVERYLKELKKHFPYVDEWQGILKEGSTPPRLRLTPQHTSFLKICDGCINKCSYCAIPLIKGPLKSKPQEEVIQEAQYLEQRGVKELSLIGQDITSWGYDLRGQKSLTHLLKSILKKTKHIRWFRLIYTHPKHISNSLIDLIAHEERICKYIDVPIQHINDRILKLMHRGVTKKEIKDLIHALRKRIPDCFIRTSVIVGFPSESKEEFSELIDFIREIKFERLGAFIYSREEDTAAYSLSGQVHPSTKKKRLNEIMSLQREISSETNQGLVGKDIEVLVDEKKDGIFIARSQYDAYEVDGAVYLKKEGLKIGDFYKAKIVDSYEYDLVGI